MGVSRVFSIPKLAALRACKSHLHEDRIASNGKTEEKAHYPRAFVKAPVSIPVRRIKESLRADYTSDSAFSAEIAKLRKLSSPPGAAHAACLRPTRILHSRPSPQNASRELSLAVRLVMPTATSDDRKLLEGCFAELFARTRPVDLPSLS